MHATSLRLVADQLMPESGLDHFEKRHDFLVAVDSDGCAFDTMEIKHKECFIPNFIRFFGLQAVAKYARECAEFANLYSKTRGANRFPAYLRSLEILAERPEIVARGFRVPTLPGLRDWIQRETKLGTKTIGPEADRTGDADLKLGHAWSAAVDASIAAIVHGVTPYPGVREALQTLSRQADLIVCSSTPSSALQSEWNEHKIAPFMQAICGQEAGRKAESLQKCLEMGYQPEKMLMIGDAPGDMNAAKKVGCRYFPINPGREEQSWECFNTEAMARFFDGSYAGDFEASLISDFESHLPDDPPWKQV